LVDPSLLATACVVCAQEHLFQRSKRDISAFAFPGEINHPNADQQGRISTTETENLHFQNREHKQLWWKLKSKPDQSKGMMIDDTT